MSRPDPTLPVPPGATSQVLDPPAGRDPVLLGLGAAEGVAIGVTVGGTVGLAVSVADGTGGGRWLNTTGSPPHAETTPTTAVSTSAARLVRRPRIRVAPFA